MTHWREYEKKKISELKAYADALEKREKLLIQTLADLSRGIGVKTEGRPWDQCMQELAARRLQDVALIRVPPRPWI